MKIKAAFRLYGVPIREVTKLHQIISGKTDKEMSDMGYDFHISEKHFPGIWRLRYTAETLDSYGNVFRGYRG
jgi:hypothetical protein